MIEAQIGYDPVNPGVKGTLEAKAADVLVGLQKRVLVDVLSVLLSSGEMEGEPQYGLIVMTYEFLEGGAVSALRLADQHRVVYSPFLPCHAATRGVLDFNDSLCTLTLSGVGPSANRKWYSPYTGRHFRYVLYLPGFSVLRAGIGIDGESRDP
jgi:hypothetical protein